ncbi:MAG: hypothetical protein Q8L55_07050 [Phycisphaerales bacterium]|nr:hypothetical protein [Phycisphaerales bacterium]
MLIPRLTRFAAASGALLALCLASACSAPLATRSAAVFVITPEGEPIAGALVRADPVDPRHPLNIADYFRTEPGTLGSWRTDTQGHAAVRLLVDRPTAVSFAAAGFVPDSSLIDPSRLSPFRLTLTPLAAESRNPR